MLALATALLVSSPVGAAFNGPTVAQPATGGGFTGPGPATSTVKEALDMRDDTPISLVGNIVRHIGGDIYLFSDQTGSVNVDIDTNKWNGQNVAPTDTVRLDGEVDRDWLNVEIDVERITKQ
ncbi:MAG TPA: TIGR00156 family protein [Desulfobulbaceae bacterium]|nr:TIGR00156 family protein [Desulfobulbaceae bacterium]